MTSGIALLVAYLVPIQIGLAGGAPEPANTTVRLDVRASPDCTTRGDLAARVAARSPRIHFVDDDTALAVEVVFTTGRSENVIGELVLAGPRGTLSSRRLFARSCAEAADAVALIIAVTLDPTSASATPATASTGTSAASAMDPAASASTGPTLPPAPATQPTTKPAEQPADVLQRAPDAVNPAVASSPAPFVAGRRRAGAHVAGQSIFGPAPTVMPGIAAYAMAALDRDALWSPAILLGATHVWRNGLVEPGGTASFTLDAASLDACPIRLQWSAFETRACGSVLLGRLSASGASTRAPATRARPFAVTGATVVLSADLGSFIELSARLGAGMTLVRDTYEFGPNVFHRAAGITSSASLGIGLRLP